MTTIDTPWQTSPTQRQHRRSTSCGQRSPRAEVCEERGPGVAGFAGRRVLTDEHRFASVLIPQAANTGSGGVRVIFEVRPVEEQVVQLDVVEAAVAPRLGSSLIASHTRDTVERSRSEQA